MSEFVPSAVPESLRMSDAMEIELLARRRARTDLERGRLLLAAVNPPSDPPGAVLVAGSGPVQGSVSSGSRFAPTVFRVRDHVRVTTTAFDRGLGRTSPGFRLLVGDVLGRLVVEARSLNEMAVDARALRTEDVDGRQPCTVLFVPHASAVDRDPALVEVCAAYHEGRWRIAAALTMLERRIELQRLREEHPELLRWWGRRAARKELAREAAVQRRLLHAAFDELSELDPVDVPGLVDAHVAARAVIATLDPHP